MDNETKPIERIFSHTEYFAETIMVPRCPTCQDDSNQIYGFAKYNPSNLEWKATGEFRGWRGDGPIVSIGLECGNGHRWALLLGENDGRIIIFSLLRNEKRPEYQDYLESPGWRKKADEAKERAGHRCQVCNVHRSDVTLDAHHRTYERLGNEEPEDITVLCRDCHALFHGESGQ